MTSLPSPPRKTIALVGLMGVGKSSIGKRLASALQLAFRDADTEIELAAGRTISEIFAVFGEAGFRDGERRVIGRLLDEAPHVLATGGGAFAQPATRELIKRKAISVWLKADLELLAKRVARRDHRPLLVGKDPMDVLQAHVRDRYPAFEQADVVVETGDAPHQIAVDAIIKALAAHEVKTA